MSLSLISLKSMKTLKKSKSAKVDFFPEQDIEISKLKQIGDYQLGQEIGSGAFGKVILGKHILTEEKVAIKILDKIILNETPEDYKLVKQELSILKIVKHKYIVRLYEIIETPRHIFIVMEYCDGGDIMNYILTRGRLTETESLKFFHQLINALYYLHSQNITHRDVKIDNLLLDSNFNLKLIDFGLSTKYKEDELLNQPCGTIVYAAPEVLDYKDYHGMLADVWSCGIVLYGMLSGFLPFGDSDDEINKKMVLEGKIKMPKFFSEGAKNLLKHMLDINPSSRYTLDDIMEHPWFNKIKFIIIPGIIVGVNKIPVDEKVVDLCVSYNLDKNKVINSIVNNKFNTESVVYYLIVQKLKRNGQDSVSDLYSQKYINYMINESEYILNNNDKSDNIINDENELDEQQQIIKEKKRIRMLCGLKRYYNILNSKNDFNNYIDIDIDKGNNLRNDNKKFINIENNFKNNIIIFDDRENLNNFEPNRTIATHRINMPKIGISKNIIDNNEDDDFFFNELMNRNSLETDRIITKGKFINNKNLGHIKKKKIAIRNKNIPLDSFLKNKYFKTLDNNNNDKNNKNIYKNNIFKNIKNINNSLVIKKHKINSNISSTINNTNSNVRYIPNNYKIKIETPNKSNLQKLEKNTVLSKENNNKYLKKSRIINTTINIPHLNISKINNQYNDNEFYKKIVKKENINTYISDNLNLNNKTTKNKSEEKRNINNTDRNKEIFHKKLLINLYNKNQKSSRIISNIEIKLKKEKDLQNKKNYNSIEGRKKLTDISLNNEKKLNKTSILNLIDNINMNTQPSKIKKNIINHTELNNKNKKDLISIGLLMQDKNETKISEFNTNRQSTNKIFNLKKNINKNFKKINFDIKKKIKHLNLNNNINKNIVFLTKNNNKINNSIIKTTINNIKKNSNIKKATASNNKMINNDEKCNTSRISVKLRNKKMRQRNLDKNFLYNKIYNISGSSILNNANKEQTKTIFKSMQRNYNYVNSLPKLGLNYNQKEKNISDTNKVKNTNAESSVVVYRKKSPFQIRDLSDSPRQKFLNEKTRKNKIPWKIKRKGIDDKLDSFKIFNKYIQKLKINKNNPLKNTNDLKKIENKNKIKTSKINLLKNNNKIKLDSKNESKELTKYYKQSNILMKNKTNDNMLNINDYKSSHQKYKINISDNNINTYANKKSKKKIKLRNLNTIDSSNKNIYTKFNNISYLTLHNDNNNYNLNFDLSGKFLNEKSNIRKDNFYVNI